MVFLLEQRTFIVKHYYEMKSYEKVQNEFKKNSSAAELC